MSRDLIITAAVLVGLGIAATMESTVSDKPRSKRKSEYIESPQTPPHKRDASHWGYDTHQGGNLNDIITPNFEDDVIEEPDVMDGGNVEDYSALTLEEQARSFAELLTQDTNGECINDNGLEFVRGQLAVLVEDSGSQKAEDLYGMILSHLDLTSECWEDSFLDLFSLTELFPAMTQLDIYLDGFEENGLVPDNVKFDATVYSLFEDLDPEDRTKVIARVCEDKEYVFEAGIGDLFDGKSIASLDYSFCRQLLAYYPEDFKEAVSYSSGEGIMASCFDLAGVHSNYKNLELRRAILWDKYVRENDDLPEFLLDDMFDEEHLELNQKLNETRGDFFNGLIGLAEDLRDGDLTLSLSPIINSLYINILNASGDLSFDQGSANYLANVVDF